MAKIRRARLSRPGPSQNAHSRVVARIVARLGKRPSPAPNLAGRSTGFTRRRPATIPMNGYSHQQRTPIAGGYGTALVDSNGDATVTCGPMGVGTIWYPQAVALATTSGAGDASTCALYLTPRLNGASQVSMTQIGGQSYTGGGDTIGVAIPPMWPGYYIVAVWAGGNPGDLASIQVYGDQDSLYP